MVSNRLKDDRNGMTVVVQKTKKKGRQKIEGPSVVVRGGAHLGFASTEQEMHFQQLVE